ncbi:antitoxin [Nonomuraea mesophila]|uniref:Antitoxin n=1 Tax=Nonomuraea mesophila TaxID=2530382 RepID=A0A4R5FXV3_9ACTN|nr:antitoxin [Nonomuraea mesophila]TDE60380.1 antitoxin [Nonomuraea mesophila]
MATPYIRDVPEPVAEAFKERAAEVGMSLSAYVAREPADITNVEIVGRLKARDRSQGPSTADILEAVTDGRR